MNSSQDPPGPAARAAARRTKTDWTIETFATFDAAEAADVEDKALTPASERLRLVFLLSGQLGERTTLPRNEWTVEVRRFGSGDK